MLTRVSTWKTFHEKIVKKGEVPSDVIIEISKISMENMNLGPAVTGNLLKTLSVENSVDTLTRIKNIKNKVYPYNGFRD